MRSSVGTCVCAVLLAGLVNGGVGLAQSTDLFDEIHTRTEEQRKTLRTARARFTETTVSSLLTQPLVARGTLVAAQPSSVLFTYLSPEPRTVIVSATRVVVIRPGRPREELDIAQTQKRVQQYFGNASLKELRGLFTIRASIDTSLPNAYLVEMEPKRKQVREGLERLVVWIDQNTLLMIQMRMQFPGGDSKTMRLEDVEVNIPVPDSTFEVPK